MKVLLIGLFALSAVEATAHVNECRLNKRNGDAVTDIQLKVRGADFGLVAKMRSNNQFGLAVSTVDIGDGELIECATMVTGFAQELKIQLNKQLLTQLTSREIQRLIT